jgi:hypothetical protein
VYCTEQEEVIQLPTILSSARLLISGYVIHEPDVSLTDYGLAAESIILARLLYRARATSYALKNSFIWFYSSAAVAAAFGGTFHGFLQDEPTGILWRAVLVTTGFTAFAAWRIGALLSFSSGTVTRISRIAIVELAVYSFIVLLFRQDFLVAIVNYLPAVVFLTFSLVLHLARSGNSSTLTGLTGLALTFVAAGVQNFRISLHPRYFNHNALYHLLQGVALLLIFAFAYRVVQQHHSSEVKHGDQT